MNQNPTAEDLRSVLKEIIATHQPGMTDTDHGNHVDVYAEQVQKRILEPMLAARGAAGAEPLDDLGHDTQFVKAWNRALRGEPDPYDYRVMASPIVHAATRGIKDRLSKLFGLQMGDFDRSIIDRLPEMLTGEKAIAPATGAGLRSWVVPLNIYIRMDGGDLVLCQKDGSPLTPPPELPACANTGRLEKPAEWFGLMSFHASGIDHDESDKAWEAFSKAADAAGVKDRHVHDCLAYMADKILCHQEALGVALFWLRQDEAISIDTNEDGFVAYRGAVEGLKQLRDEGQFICGPRAAFMNMLMEGGFSKAGAGRYLDRLAAADSAFATMVPAGSAARFTLDAETLYAFDQEPHAPIRCKSPEEAVPIYAAGLNLPEMLSHRQRKARLDASAPEPVDEGPQP